MTYLPNNLLFGISRKLLILGILILLNLVNMQPVFALQPANPNATAQSKQLLDYLVNLPDKPNNRVISGQHLAGSTRYNVATTLKNVQDLYNSTGKWVGIIGAGYGDSTLVFNHSTNQVLIDYWKNGGLVEIYYPVNNPWTGGKSSDSSVNINATNINELLTGGGTCLII